MTKSVFGLLIAITLGLGTAACAETSSRALDYQLLRTIDREPRAFTQGLEFYRGDLLQSSGLVGQSYLHRIPHPLNPSAKAKWRLEVPAPYFAEGLTVHDDTLWLLSWQRQTAWEIDPDSGDVLGRHRYRGQGWGLASAGDFLIRTDGSDQLIFHTSAKFEEIKRLPVRWEGRSVKRLNELEYARGLLWANIWQSNTVVAIDPQSGEVLAHLDLTELASGEPHSDRDNVLNGIAYDAQSDSFWVTGKRWRAWYQLAIPTFDTPEP